MAVAEIVFDPSSITDYDRFLRVKSLPQYRFIGDRAEFPVEYAKRLGVNPRTNTNHRYRPIAGLFDYQVAITRLAIQKRKFCVFADCGLGKTLIFLEFLRHACRLLPASQRALIVSPLMVIPQTIQEAHAFYNGRLAVEQIHAADLANWMEYGQARIGITNYEAMKPELQAANLGALVLDESSMLKSHYGKWGRKCLELGRGLEWKLACTGTPAPNDRIEYANHAVFMDAFPTVNSFLARFFVNRGQTDNRWDLKPHALEPFYRALSHWCIFLANPGVYGWKDNADTIPPIYIHVHDVAMTIEQRQRSSAITGQLFATEPGGIGSRSALSQIAKGHHRGQAISTKKFAFIRSLIDSWPDESTLIWCLYNAEQRMLERTFPEAASLAGDTPIAIRQRLIDEFKSGRRRVLISKPKILGFGLNLQIATRQVFSGLQDSYEQFYQAVKRSNRVGSTRPLHVHIPVSEIERPMIQTVLTKADRILQDTNEQERIFRDVLKF